MALEGTQAGRRENLYQNAMARQYTIHDFLHLNASKNALFLNDQKNCNDREHDLCARFCMLDVSWRLSAMLASRNQICEDFFESKHSLDFQASSIAKHQIHTHEIDIIVGILNFVDKLEEEDLAMTYPETSADIYQGHDDAPLLDDIEGLKESE